MEIVEGFECVCFHMTDLPFGRGGSPLQNLILRGVRETKVSALRMTDTLDAGPVYARESLQLDGSAQDIYERCAEVVFDMVVRIVNTTPEPIPQSGEVVTFTRRTPSMSLVPTAGSCEQLHDFIRMLDAESYPSAFLDHGKWRIEFSRSRWVSGVLMAEARFIERASTQ